MVKSKNTSIVVYGDLRKQHDSYHELDGHRLAAKTILFSVHCIKIVTPSSSDSVIMEQWIQKILQNEENVNIQHNLYRHAAWRGPRATRPCQSLLSIVHFHLLSSSASEWERWPIFLTVLTWPHRTHQMTDECSERLQRRLQQLRTDKNAAGEKAVWLTRLSSTACVVMMTGRVNDDVTTMRLSLSRTVSFIAGCWGWGWLTPHQM